LPEEESNKLVYVKKNLGATQSPFDAFLVSNGMKTLPLRMEKHCTNAQIIAEYLEDHPKVETVYYPGLPDHPQHKLARKQMHGKFGGMMGCELKGGIEAGRILMNSVKVFTLAVSLGCIDSLIQHPVSMTHVSVPKSIRLQGGITDGLIRVSVGIENVEDLIEDLDQALNKIS
jgi:methionine-gamma-lyase